MRTSLGEKIGEGLFADVHAWAPGQVVKLSKAGVPRRIGWWEARMTRAAFAAGAPAPEVLDEVTVDGRFGIVMPRFDGPTLLQLTRSGAVTFERAGAILATFAMAIHRTPPPREALLLRDYMESALRYGVGALPAHLAAGVLALIDRLTPGDGLCHCDLHPGNVVMAADGPRLVDWAFMVRAPAALDIGISHVLLSELTPGTVDNPERPRAVEAALRSEYGRLAGVSAVALTAAIDPYVPVIYALCLLGGNWPAHRERMIRHVEAALDLEAGAGR